MKYLIIGLGNIGSEYINTRHNIGFKALDWYCKNTKAEFRTKRFANIAKSNYKGRNLILVKPSTYMNLSGKAVRYWMQKENIDINNILIIVDDISIPFGSIRIKQKGSDAGHNGLADIISILGHNKFNRLRFGIGDNFHKGQQIDFVLGKWTDKEQEILPEKLDIIKDAINSFVTIGIERTMNYFN